MKESVSVTAQNSFSSLIRLKGLYNVSISGTFVATITIQRTLDGGTTWNDVCSYTAPVEDVRLASTADPLEVVYRIGCKTGGFTSGTAVCVLTQ